MSALIYISPIIFVIASILLFRIQPMKSALCGIIFALLLWGGGFVDAFNGFTLHSIILDTGTLFLSVATVIVPGLLFVMYIEKKHVAQQISQWFNTQGWAIHTKLILIVLGFAPLLESMTGFGVSLIVTIPILLVLFNKGPALKIALSGMVIMPWGTLGLATMVGASLAYVPVGALATQSALTSALVFLCLSGLAMYWAQVNNVRAWSMLVGCWGIFILVLYGVSRLLGPELAGVLAGLTVILLLFVVEGINLKKYPLPKKAWPYLVLFLVIVVFKLVVHLFDLSDKLLIQGDRVTWRALISPFLPLCVAVVAMFICWQEPISPKALWHRAKKPLGTILLFLLLAQIMTKAGFIAQLQTTFNDLPKLWQIPLLSAMATLSGYVTGSGIGGNALIMPSVQNLDESVRLGFAAVVNSAAGHGAMGSLGILSLIFGLANVNKDLEHSILRYGFVVVLINFFLVTVSALGISFLRAYLS
jgi:lactate permease